MKHIIVLLTIGLLTSCASTPKPLSLNGAVYYIPSVVAHNGIYQYKIEQGQHMIDKLLDNPVEDNVLLGGLTAMDKNNVLYVARPAYRTKPVPGKHAYIWKLHIPSRQATRLIKGHDPVYLAQGNKLVFTELENDTADNKNFHKCMYIADIDKPRITKKIIQCGHTYNPFPMNGLLAVGKDKLIYSSKDKNLPYKYNTWLYNATTGQHSHMPHLKGCVLWLADKELLICYQETAKRYVFKHLDANKQPNIHFSAEFYDLKYADVNGYIPAINSLTIRKGRWKWRWPLGKSGEQRDVYLYNLETGKISLLAERFSPHKIIGY